MDLFITAELANGAGTPFLEARTEVQDVLEAALAKKDYGPGVVAWYLVAIIIPADFGLDLQAWYPETREYEVGKRYAAFRLAIDHADFVAADPIGRRRLLCGLLLRSVADAEGMGIPGLDAAALQQDILAAATGRGWLKLASYSADNGAV